MAVFRPASVTCSCGQAFKANLARSVNVKRNPGVRNLILGGEFHHVRCPACAKEFNVERPFYYSDPIRKAVFLVRPRGERVDHTLDGKLLTKQSKNTQILCEDAPVTQMRVVYGLDELREKLVAQDAGYDDRHVELLKIIVLHEHPFLLKVPRLQLVLSNVTSVDVQFVAYHHNQQRSYEIQISRFLVEDFLGGTKTIETWVKGSKLQESLLAPSRRWVNFRRFSLRYSALDTLRNFAKKVEAGQAVNLNAAEFKTMCDRLPRASDLPNWAKQDLRTLFEYAKSKKNGRAQDRLFEVRFGIALDDEWATNTDPDDIDTLWQLMKSVPVSNVEGNVNLKEIELIAGGGGLYQWNGVVQIGREELSDREGLEDVLRHEVGHAVHENRKTLIDKWLVEKFGWQRFAADQASINQWIELMGGWDTWGKVTTQQRVEISNALFQALGRGERWEPGAPPRFPSNHPWNTAAFGPRLAAENSLAAWYDSFPGWYRINGKAFFLNYWYAEFMVVNESALKLVEKMPSSYAAMSHYEFFAELYALYYDADDPQRKAIPADVAKWLDENIGKPTRGNPRRRKV